MNRLTLAAQASVLALALTLAGCGGGGGVGSTPTPTPTPAPTPTPSPTPTPTPAATNPDLIAPLVTETFINNMARGAANFSAGGTSGTAAQASGTIRYDAGSNAYTLTTPGGAITFGAGDIDAAQSNAGAVVYQRTSGSTTDSLTITRPGTSGRVTYQYVGGAFWQHTVQGSSTASGWIDAFAYGVPTAVAGVPTSGSANYDVDLIGAETAPQTLNGLAGSGVASIDFTTGVVVITGTLAATLTPGLNTNWAAQAQMGSAGSFSGSFTFEDFGTFNGNLAGRLYGPAAQEIGASFAASQSDGRIAVGTITGRQGTGDVGNASFGSGFPPLANSQSFSALSSRTNLTLEGASGSNNGTEAFSATSTRIEGLSVRYDALTDRYTLVAPDLSQTIKLGQPLFTSGTGQADLSLSAGPAGTSYVRIGEWLNYTGRGALTDYRRDYFSFGMDTPNSGIVRTGTAGFKVAVVGGGADADFHNITRITGTGNFFVDFAAGQLRALIPVISAEHYFMSGRPAGMQRGDLTFTGTLSASANAMSGTAALNGIGNYTGTMNGRFYGPAAEEVGGAFSLTDGAGGALSGAFAGARDATVTDPAIVVPTIAGLTSQTNLFVRQWAETQTPDSISNIAYDPATQAYLVTLPTTTALAAGTASFSAASRDATQTVAGFDQHTVIFPSGLITHALLLKPDNATVQLSYLSLGSFAIERGSYAGDWHRYFTAHGIATPAVPSSGSASYQGVALAYAKVSQRISDFLSYTDTYDVTGNASFQVNFSNQTFTSSLTSLVGQRSAVYSFSDPAGATFNFNPLTYTGDIVGGRLEAGGNSSHFFFGNFFGPAAAELGGNFFERVGTPGVDPLAVEMSGVAGAKKVP